MGSPRRTNGGRCHERVRRPVSRVLSAPFGAGWPFLWDARCRAPRATDPGGGAETRFAGCPACRPYLVLLPVGFAVPLALPLARWALTPPFHPCLPYSSKRARPTGGLFSVALSLGSPPPAVSRHRVSVEPGLSSPRGCPRSAAIRPSDPRRDLVPLPYPVTQAGDQRPCLRIGDAVSLGRPIAPLEGRDDLLERQVGGVAHTPQRRLHVTLDRRGSARPQADARVRQ